MHLLNVTTLKTDQFLDEKNRPPYAILSHTWLPNSEEVTFEDLEGYHDAVAQAQQLEADSIASRPGFKKIQDCCNLAARSHNLEWAWIDTCCIDKRSSAELSEAINSMFKWYQEATICYAFLQDVTGSEYNPSFRESKWFTRGWTLQELIAPNRISFFDQKWQLIGAMDEDSKLCDIVSSITLIPVAFLKGAPLTDACVAKKMSWASKRQTTRSEDVAYCLLGLFGVNMPLLYGEGGRAFIRLQEHIISQTQDDSILAWGSIDPVIPMDHLQINAHDRSCVQRSRGCICWNMPTVGALAISPADFKDGGDFEIGSRHPSSEYQMTAAGFRLGVKIYQSGRLNLCELSCFRWRHPLQRIFLFLADDFSATRPYRCVRQGRRLSCGLPWSDSLSMSLQAYTGLGSGKVITIAKNVPPSIEGIPNSRHRLGNPNLKLILLDLPRSHTGNAEYTHPGFGVEMNTHRLGKNSLRIVYSPENSNIGRIQGFLILLLIIAPIYIPFLEAILFTWVVEFPLHNKLWLAFIFISGLQIVVFFRASREGNLYRAIVRLFRRTWFFMIGKGAGLRVNRCAVRACIRITKQGPRFPSSDAEQMMVIVSYCPQTNFEIRKGRSINAIKPELTCHLITVPMRVSDEESVHPTSLDRWLRVYKNLEVGGKTYTMHNRELITGGEEHDINVLFHINVKES